MIDKKAIFTLISETISNDEIKMIVEMLDRLWRENKIEMDERDWPVLSQIVQDAKTKNDEIARSTAP